MWQVGLVCYCKTEVFDSENWVMVVCRGCYSNTCTCSQYVRAGCCGKPVVWGHDADSSC
jgi:hypothetical protein